MARICPLVFIYVLLQVAWGIGTIHDLGIYGGQKVTIESVPFMVALYIKNKERIYFCGGSILHKKFVLTAAHCLRNVTDPSAIWGFAGVDNLKETDKGQSIKVEKVLCHKDYVPSSHFENDICIFKLRNSLKYDSRVVSVKLPSENFDLETGTLVSVSGWGEMEKEKNPQHLIQVTVPIVSKEYCKDKDTICAGVEGRGTCTGDSGGPLMYGKVQVGIVSHRHYSSCSGKHGSVYTRVASYMKWIQDIINNS